MTFIATVIAKKGAAIIADSLVTTTKPVLGYDEFLSYLTEKEKASEDKEIIIDPKEISDLFKQKRSHTKDYEEKLLQYDDYTAITTAGWAVINDQKIESIIAEIAAKNKKNIRSYKSKKIETKVKELSSFLASKVKDHLSKHNSIGATTFILTHYEKSKEETHVYKIDVLRASKKDLEKESFEFVKYIKHPDAFKVICDGQNRISERILFGEFDLIVELVPKVVERVFKDFGLDEKKMPKDYIEGLLKNRDIVKPEFFDDMKIFRLTDLSLQQAVDLAWLLMRIEMDFQKYTEEIPTVGGVIKLAVVDKNGFRYIAGDTIDSPEK